MEKIEREIALLRQQMDFLREQQEQAQREHEEFLERAKEIEAQIGRTGSDADSHRGEIDACGAAIETCQAQRDGAQRRVDETEKHLEVIRAREVERMNERARTQTELETLAVGIRNTDVQLQEIQARQSTNHGRDEELRPQLESARTQEAEKQAQLDGVVSERTAAIEDHAGKQQDLRAVSDEWQNLRERKSSQEARLNSLRELRDSYEGYATGVKAVMMAKQRNMTEARGVIGPIADLISTDKAYERAIEAALGGNVNNVVVEEADAAKAAVRGQIESAVADVAGRAGELATGKRPDAAVVSRVVSEVMAR
ncbi:MAG: Chromosome partition protein Smc [Alphaproteobacteria bacterium ADurb.BinA305]|nr:MAG: Chromosome partition protein Smc [Alphaproteobacteria bacterium ADurb.BinA305]